MTARAVAPLPPDAIPHWQQYSDKKHENISPKTIDFKYQCESQDAPPDPARLVWLARD